jgi:hypothetical protein
MTRELDVAHFAMLELWLEQLGLAGAQPVRQVTDEHGAYSPAGRWIVEMPDGARRFVKAMQARPLATGRNGVEHEHAVYAGIDSPHVPVLHAWLEGNAATGEPSILVVEDLGGAMWGVPLHLDRVRALRVALDALAKTSPPSGLSRLDPTERWRGCGWAALLRAPSSIVERGVLDSAWLDRHGEALAAAEAEVELRGDDLVHGDLWLQNWCTVGDRAVLVDWTGASLGNHRINHAWGECGVRAAGGPGGLVLGADDPDHAMWAAWMSGLACSFLASDEWDRIAMPRLHETELREAIAAIGWACDALGLPRPVVDAAAIDVGPWRP